MKNVLLVALGALMMFSLPATAAGRRERTFTIYYTGSLNGNLDGCECKAAPKAGLVKRAVFLRTRRTTDSLLVDTGDILDVAPDPELTRQILEVYRELHYDAVAVGDQDLSNGLEAFLKRVHSNPFVCNNLVILTGGREERVSSAPLVFRRDALTVAVGALIDPEVFVLYPPGLKARLKILSVQKTAASLLDQMTERDADLTVLLYHGSVESAEALARSVPGFDVIIVGHEQRLVDARTVGTAVLISPGEEGNRVGILSFTVSPEGLSKPANRFKRFNYMSDPDDPAVRKRIEIYKQRLRDRLRADKQQGTR